MSGRLRRATLPGRSRKSKPMAPAAALRPGILEDGNVVADDSE